jgi:hypothetical protein
VVDESKNTSLRQVLRTKYLTLLLIPTLNLTLIVVFWQSQIAHYTVSTEGIVLMWLVAGLLFGFIQASLLIGAWRQTTRNRAVASSQRFETLWLLGAQIFTLGVMSIYSGWVIGMLLYLGVSPTQPFDYAIMAIFVVTLLTVLRRYRPRELGDPHARLWLAAGTKAAPQVLQAGGLAWSGSFGMHPVTLLTVVAMTTLRYALAHATRRRQAIAHTISVDRAAFLDLLAVCTMVVGWLIGRIGLVHSIYCLFHPNQAGTRDDPGLFIRICYHVYYMQ